MCRTCCCKCACRRNQSMQLSTLSCVPLTLTWIHVSQFSRAVYFYLLCRYNLSWIMRRQAGDTTARPVSSLARGCRIALFQLRVPLLVPAEDEVEHRFPTRHSSMASCNSSGSVVRFVRACAVCSGSCCILSPPPLVETSSKCGADLRLKDFALIDTERLRSEARISSVGEHWHVEDLMKEVGVEGMAVRWRSMFLAGVKAAIVLLPDTPRFEPAAAVRTAVESICRDFWDPASCTGRLKRKVAHRELK